MKYAALFIVLFLSRSCTGSLTIASEYCPDDTNTVGYKLKSCYQIDSTSGLILETGSTVEDFKNDSELLIEYYFEF